MNEDDIIETKRSEVLQKIYKENKILENFQTPEENKNMFKVADNYLEKRKHVENVAMITHIIKRYMNDNSPVFRRVKIEELSFSEKISFLNSEINDIMFKIIIYKNDLGFFAKNKFMINLINNKFEKINWYEKFYAYYRIFYCNFLLLLGR